MGTGLDEFVADFQRDEADERRRLAEEKSYAITEHLEGVAEQFEERVALEALVELLGDAF